MATGAQSQVRWEGFEAAHGFVRDGLASIRNVETLLKSPRIGPKALEKVVAELRPGIEPLGDAFSMLISWISDRSPGLEVASSLQAYIREHVDLLKEAIERANNSDMGAKARLQLEAKVVQLGVRLNAARDLVDLLDAATKVRPTELDLNALSTEALAKLAPSCTKHPRVVHVTYVPAAHSATVVTDPKVVMPLMAAALGLAARNKAKSIQVVATVDNEDGTRLTCSAQTNGLPTATPCLVPYIVAPTLDVARAAASLAGATFAFDESERCVRVTIPPGLISQTVVKPDATMQQ